MIPDTAKLKWLLIVAVCFFIGSCSSFSRSAIESPKSRIKIKVERGIKNNPMKNDETVAGVKNISEERMKNFVAAIYFEKRTLIGSVRENPVFLEPVVPKFSRLLLKALRQSGKKQRVKFAVTDQNGNTQGYCFLRGKGICWVLEEINGTPFISRDPFRAREIEISRGNDDEESVQAWKLAPRKGQRYFPRQDILGIRRKMENSLCARIKSQ